MNLEDVLDPNYGLQQDEWSLTRPRFGEEGQLEVVGWSGRSTQSHKYYVLKCNKCGEDKELFGEGLFRSLKGHLVKGAVPCGCSKKPEWSKTQFYVLCKRNAKELGFKFLGFEGDWKGNNTKIKMLCAEHGEWSSGIIHNLIDKGHTCPECSLDSAAEARTKPDPVVIAAFFASGAFHPETKFWRSEKTTKYNRRSYWYMLCPECGEVGESTSGSLQLGQRPCACSKHRQKEGYINWVLDGQNMTIAIKFGIANNSKRRVKQQDSKSTYNLVQYCVYTFPSVQSCKRAEKECKQELKCGVVLKSDMLDGWSETTWAYNLDKIIEIYERNGGVEQ